MKYERFEEFDFVEYIYVYIDSLMQPHLSIFTSLFFLHTYGVTAIFTLYQTIFYTERNQNEMRTRTKTFE